ncbi:hypothetical protein QBC40DRAFT_261401 [Triangularia verruculosa]|uniref:Uncharacterized protein n=1 Tax=Triangularia verruculosa TaxID=2587418 RepID=A0AAN7B1D1_9PEZI|nr:hypothetical protein QBC40DRAFT_261401 [Triangularia verruculosa]
MPKDQNRNEEEEEAARQATAGLVKDFEQLLGDIGRGSDFPMARARAVLGAGAAAAPSESNVSPTIPRGLALAQPSSPPAFDLPPVPRLPLRARNQRPPTASNRHVSPLPRSPLGAVEPIVASESGPEPGLEADGSPGEAASTDRRGGREQINPQKHRPGMFSLFPTRSNAAAVKMTASPTTTTSPSQGSSSSSSPLPGSRPENLASPGLPSSVSSVSVASAAPPSAPVSAGEASSLGSAGHLEPNNPFGYPAPPPFRHNWANPNRRAARGAVLSGTLSGVVVGSRPRPSVSASLGVTAVPFLPPRLPVPTGPPPPVPPPSRPPPPIPVRNPARLGSASPAASRSAGDDEKTPAAENEKK